MADANMPQYENDYSNDKKERRSPKTNFSDAPLHEKIPTNEQINSRWSANDRMKIPRPMDKQIPIG